MSRPLTTPSQTQHREAVTQNTALRWQVSSLSYNNLCSFLHIAFRAHCYHRVHCSPRLYSPSETAPCDYTVNADIFAFGARRSTPDARPCSSRNTPCVHSETCKLDGKRFHTYCAHLRDMYNFDPLAVDRVLKEMRSLAANGQSSVGRIDADGAETCALINSGRKETAGEGGETLPAVGGGKDNVPSCNIEGATEVETGRRDTSK